MSAFVDQVDHDPGKRLLVLLGTHFPHLLQKALLFVLGIHLPSQEVPHSISDLLDLLGAHPGRLRLINPVAEEVLPLLKVLENVHVSAPPSA
ncbi:protein of unknown function [Kyrpidia spormannii]|uniref:Uncharacterized protein n=1 Tax=Kyrpidia spormannii TaxID=2055160 RepID=A0A6F9EEG2_9BACL|nr:protein of unknown function [Kyrpidia spormannii]